MMSQSPSATTRGTEQKRIAELPIPESDVLGLTSLSHLRPSGQIQLEGHSTPLIIGFVGVRRQDIIDSTTKQYALKTSHGRADAKSHELCEQINLADGSVIQTIDIDGQPVRTFEVAQ